MHVPSSPRRIVALLLAAWPVAGLLRAQGQPVPSIDSVAHSASYWRAGLNQAGLAQGSLFVVLGSNLGPSQLVQGQFPLTGQLGGSSVRIQVGSSAVQALMIYTLDRQIGAVLPSRTPVGTGSLTVTFNGLSSASVPLTVAPAAFGVYTLNQGGTGPGAVTTAAYQVIGPSFAANPGETLIAWGTGLGAVSGDESAGPLVGNLGGAEVFVGTKPAVVHYAGRSGCCAGVDQVAFDVPAGVTGCFVPLMVRSRGVASNFSSIAVAAAGRMCSDPLGLPPSALVKAAAGADLRFGAITLGLQPTLATLSSGIGNLIAIDQFTGNSLMSALSRIVSAGTRDRRQARKRIRDAVRAYREAKQNGKAAKPGWSAIRAEAAGPPVEMAAEFGLVHDVAPALSYVVANASAVGSCSVGVCVTPDCGFPAVLPKRHGSVLDAGISLAVSGPAGASLMPKSHAGEYRAILPVASSVDGDLPPGTYTVSGSGGADVASFSATLALPATVHWTNQSQIYSVNRQADLTITWNSSYNSGHVLIGGTSSNRAAGQTGVFLCSEESAKGSFTIPSFVLSAMPAGATARGYLFVASHPLDNAFTAPGLDLGFFRETSVEMKIVIYQ